MKKILILFLIILLIVTVGYVFNVKTATLCDDPPCGGFKVCDGPACLGTCYWQDETGWRWGPTQCSNTN